MDICRLRKALMRYEGTKKRGDRHILYKDSVGITTIGYGRNIQERGISNAEASMLLRNDIDDSVKDMLKVFPWVEDLDDVRAEVVLVQIAEEAVDELAPGREDPRIRGTGARFVQFLPLSALCLFFRNPYSCVNPSVPPSLLI